MKQIKKHFPFIILLVLINLILIALRITTKDPLEFTGSIVSTILFIAIFAVLLIYFFAKKYDYFIVLFLSIYFATFLLQPVFTQVGALGLLNAIFLPLMLIVTFNKTDKTYILILVLILFSIIHTASLDARLLLSRIFQYSSPFIFMYFVAKKCTDKVFILHASVLIALINTPLAFYQYFFSPQAGTFSDWRGIRVFGNLFWPNAYAVYLLPVILTAYTYLKQKRDIMHIGMLSILSIAAIFTFSRAGLFAIVVSLLAYHLLFTSKKKLSWKKAIFFLILTLAIVQFIPDQAQVLSERTSIWKDITPLILEDPIIGKGVGSYEEYRENVIGGLSTHNYYLNMLFELGIVGLLLTLAIIAYTTKSIQKSSYTKLGLSVLFGLLIYSFLGGAAFSQAVALNAWVLIGCCMEKKQ